MKLRGIVPVLILVLFSFAVPSGAESGPEPPRPLTSRGEDNLVAFTRLLGILRYFHPSDQAAAADWGVIAIQGVREVERAADAKELAHALYLTFNPVAPTARFFVTGSPVPLLHDALRPSDSPHETLAWVHRGLGGIDTLFSDERVTPANSKVPLPEPGKPLVIDLPGGVSALIPLALYQGEDGTLPHSTIMITEMPLRDPPTGNDRAVRLADVALAWNVPQHFFPYFDVVKVDWPAVLRTTLREAATDRDERAFVDTLNRMLAALQDGHASAWHRSEDRSARLPILWEWIEGQLVITHVAPGVSGVERGDVVLAIDGRPAREVVLGREALTSGTPQFRRFGAIFLMALGPQDSEVYLVVRRPSGETASAAVRRTLPFRGMDSLPEPRPEKIAEVRPGIFYLDLDRITDEDFQGALDRLSKARGIVFDLRGHPNFATPQAILGHLSDKTMELNPSFIPVATRPDHEGIVWEPVSWSIPPAAPRLKARIAFLTDGRAVSAPETFLSFVESYHLGDVVGSTSAGTNGNMIGFQVPGGYRLFLTGLRGTKADGSPHHGVGIRPTVPATRTLQGVIAGRDEVLEKGIEVVGNSRRDRG